MTDLKLVFDQKENCKVIDHTVDIDITCDEMAAVVAALLRGEGLSGCVTANNLLMNPGGVCCKILHYYIFYLHAQNIIHL